MLKGQREQPALECSVRAMVVYTHHFEVLAELGVLLEVGADDWVGEVGAQRCVLRRQRAALVSSLAGLGWRESLHRHSLALPKLAHIGVDLGPHEGVVIVGRHVPLRHPPGCN